ncbi:LOW QUALITY PROTEIN: hypothetical protein Dda_5600 [Drechslerella dactyloides]|uniref:Uncharacterized protein n=1 Tax=Drechslerella dactyloides TaxID=74499 RepID=A0AAD6IWT7_DREDA|nr:LOW QUALITY PROTEIN: hypothetical protein Dda_5600 [Drechslerella dactyloides]
MHHDKTTTTAPRSAPPPPPTGAPPIGGGGGGGGAPIIGGGGGAGAPIIGIGGGGGGGGGAAPVGMGGGGGGDVNPFGLVGDATDVDARGSPSPPKNLLASSAAPSRPTPSSSSSSSLPVSPLTTLQSSSSLRGILGAGTVGCAVNLWNGLCETSDAAAEAAGAVAVEAVVEGVVAAGKDCGEVTDEGDADPFEPSLRKKGLVSADAATGSVSRAGGGGDATFGAPHESSGFSLVGVICCGPSSSEEDWSSSSSFSRSSRRRLESYILAGCIVKEGMGSLLFLRFGALDFSLHGGEALLALFRRLAGLGLPPGSFSLGSRTLRFVLLGLLFQRLDAVARLLLLPEEFLFLASLLLPTASSCARLAAASSSLRGSGFAGLLLGAGGGGFFVSTVGGPNSAASFFCRSSSRLVDSSSACRRFSSRSRFSRSSRWLALSAGDPERWMPNCAILAAIRSSACRLILVARSSTVAEEEAVRRARRGGARWWGGVTGVSVIDRVFGCRASFGLDGVPATGPVQLARPLEVVDELPDLLLDTETFLPSSLLMLARGRRLEALAATQGVLHRDLDFLGVLFDVANHPLEALLLVASSGSLVSQASGGFFLVASAGIRRRGFPGKLRHTCLHLRSGAGLRPVGLGNRAAGSGADDVRRRAGVGFRVLEPEELQLGVHDAPLGLANLGRELSLQGPLLGAGISGSQRGIRMGVNVFLDTSDAPVQVVGVAAVSAVHDCILFVLVFVLDIDGVEQDLLFSDLFAELLDADVFARLLEAAAGLEGTVLHHADTRGLREEVCAGGPSHFRVRFEEALDCIHRVSKPASGRWDELWRQSRGYVAPLQLAVYQVHGDCEFIAVETALVAGVRQRPNSLQVASIQAALTKNLDRLRTNDVALLQAVPGAENVVIDGFLVLGDGPRDLGVTGESSSSEPALVAARLRHQSLAESLETGQPARRCVDEAPLSWPAGGLGLQGAEGAAGAQVGGCGTGGEMVMDLSGWGGGGVGMLEVASNFGTFVRRACSGAVSGMAKEMMSTILETSFKIFSGRVVGRPWPDRATLQSHMATANSGNIRWPDFVGPDGLEGGGGEAGAEEDLLGVVTGEGLAILDAGFEELLKLGLVGGGDEGQADVWDLDLASSFGGGGGGRGGLWYRRLDGRLRGRLRQLLLLLLLELRGDLGHGRSGSEGAGEARDAGLLGRKTSLLLGQAGVLVVQWAGREGGVAGRLGHEALLLISGGLSAELAGDTEAGTILLLL